MQVKKCVSYGQSKIFRISDNCILSDSQVSAETEFIMNNIAE